ncbi:hypothetical protein D3C75_1186630 [compost metagenome]
MAIIYSSVTSNKMHMLAISNRNSRSGSNLFQIMKMVQKIGFIKINFMDMAVPCPDCLPRHTCEPMVMPICACFGQFSTTFKFMYMPLCLFKKMYLSTF